MDPWINEVINMPIAKLSIGNRFKSVMAEQNFTRLEELMNLPLIELVSKKWFTKEMVEELAEFMLRAKNEHTS